MIPASGGRPVYLRRSAACFWLALFVLCSRAWLISAWGSPAPFWDQWNAEALGLYLPWLRGEFNWATLFAAHNEHRIALTRLASLALLEWNHDWSVWGQLLLNAFLHATTAAVLACTFWAPLGSRGRAVFIAVLAGWFAAPWGWQNALWGFQSQFYFSNLLSIGALALLSGNPPLERHWWLGWLAASLALLANATGVLAAIIALILALISLAHGRTPRLALAAVALAAIMAAGLALRVEPAAHAALHAHTMQQFLGTFARALAWPHVEHGWLCLLLQLPLATLCFLRWRAHAPLDTAERCAVAFGLLALAHAAAVAYARGGGLVGLTPLSRYQDSLLPGVAAQLFALLRLTATGSRAARVATLGWLGISAAGLLALTETNLSLHLPRKRLLDREGIAAIRVYLGTGDARALHQPHAAQALHPSDPNAVRLALDEPLLRERWPEEFTAALDAPIAHPPWFVRHGMVLTCLSSLLLAAFLFLLLRPRPS